MKAGGRLALIHRADALGEVLKALDAAFGAISVLPVYPRSGQAATRILVSAVRGARAPLVILSGFVLHQADGRWTQEAEDVLNGSRGLDDATQFHWRRD